MGSVTQEAIEQRLAALRAQREQLILNVNAYNGAIEDCEYWLSVARGSMEATELKVVDG